MWDREALCKLVWCWVKERKLPERSRSNYVQVEAKKKKQERKKEKTGFTVKFVVWFSMLPLFSFNKDGVRKFRMLVNSWNITLEKVYAK